MMKRPRRSSVRPSLLPVPLLAAIAVALAALPVSQVAAEEPEEAAQSSDAEAQLPDAEAPVIADGSKVSLEYTLTLDDGQVADTNVGGAPLTYQQGAGQLLPALEAQLVGLGVGATKEVDLSPEQGYGAVNEELYETVEKERIPEDAHTVGAMLVAQSDGGQQRPVRVHEVNEEEIVLDLNHPLAGKNLHFAIKVLAIH